MAQLEAQQRCAAIENLRVPARSIPRDSPTFLMRTFATKGAPNARDLRRRLAAVNAPQLRAGIFVDEIHSFGRWRVRTGALCDEEVMHDNACWVFSTRG